ncbi:MAG: hypothetical protein LBT59_27065 [Clostridiales bacterium]|nr:hypothetical protein [Clostridiales bacterium]
MRSCAYCSTMLGDRETFCTYCGALVPPAPESPSAKLSRFLSPPPPLVLYAQQAPEKGYLLKAIYKIFFIVFGIALATVVALNVALNPIDLKIQAKAIAIAERLASNTETRLQVVTKNLSMAINKDKLNLLGDRYNKSIQEKAYYLGGEERLAASGPYVRGFDGVKPAMERLGPASSEFAEKVKGYYQGAKGRITALLP